MKAGKLIAVVVCVAVIVALIIYIFIKQRVNTLAGTTTTPQQALAAIKTPLPIIGVTNTAISETQYQYSNNDALVNTAIAAAGAIIGGIGGAVIGTSVADQSANNEVFDDYMTGIFG